MTETKVLERCSSLIQNQDGQAQVRIVRYLYDKFCMAGFVVGNPGSADEEAPASTDQELF